MAHEDVSRAGIEIIRKRNDVYIAIYRCSCCGSEVTVPRQKGRKRGVEHIKDLWCPYCKETRKFVEVEPY